MKLSILQAPPIRNKTCFQIFELPIVLGFYFAKGGANREFFLFSPHRLNLARRCGSKPPLPFGAGRGQWASAGGAATRNVAYKIRYGKGR